MYFHKSPHLLKSVISDAIWQIDTKEKEVFFTFDDGPHPEVTPFILDVLKENNAKGTFFCVGENILKYPKVYERIILEGHQIGNHTFSHNDGWDTNNFSYLKSYLKCQELTKSTLFRPPYGKISPQQYQVLKKRTKIIMWSILSGDFDKDISNEKCYESVISNIENGSIIVFHDSEKAKERVCYALPRVVKNLKSQGYSFKAISDSLR